MTKKSYRASEEVQQEIDKLMAEADALNGKVEAGEELSEEEQARLAEIVAALESMSGELESARTQEKYVEVKERLEMPVKPAVRYSQPVHVAGGDGKDFAKGLGLWLQGPRATRTADAYRTAKSVGFTLGDKFAHLPIAFDKLNFTSRRMLTTGGSGTGAELIYQTFSDRLTEYMTYVSPVLGLVPTETTNDGNARTYYIVDDTALEATEITASSGTEAAPTIPDKDIATANKVLKCKEITSGYHKVSFQELRDSYVGLPDKIAKAAANSIARKVEKDLFVGAGDGDPEVEGILSVVDDLSDVASFSDANIETLYFSVPSQYRANAIWISNSATYVKIRAALKDDMNRSMLETDAKDGIEWDVMKGKKYVVSENVPNDQLLFINLDYYQLRFAAGINLFHLEEKFFPAQAWSSMISFAGGWLGPTAAAKSLSLT